MYTYLPCWGENMLSPAARHTHSVQYFTPGEPNSLLTGSMPLKIGSKKWIAN